MKIASGLQYMPDIYIINDPALNAFATGRDPEHTAVVVTSGLLKQLNRDELQGVIGHEIAHIKNQDVLLMVIAGILLGSMELLAWRAPMAYIQHSSRFRRNGFFSDYGHRELSEEETKVIFGIAGIFLFPLILLMPVLARVVYFAISRNREYLADASSALYTRYPEGLASALERIADSTGQIKSVSKATAPMYIVNPYRRGITMTNLSRTHPPISERIQILRGMGGVSYQNYDASFMEIHRGSGGIIPASELGDAGIPVVKERAAVTTDDPSRLRRVRETSEVVWKLNNYTSIACGCGTKLRIPPGFKGSSITCPRCRMRHPLAHR
jgi:heat shock protein HtpX